MGNSSSTNVFLTVNDSRSHITAGSTLSGELRCPDGSVSTDLFASVRLLFIGKEDVEVQYKEAGPGAKAGGAYKAATRDIVRTVVPLDTSQHGTGRYPFRFDVPGHLPSSMHYKDGHGGYASIRYKVKLQLLHGTDQEVPLEITARTPPTPPVPSVADPMPTTIAFLYCIPQGNVTWAAAAENTRVGIGEEVTVNLGLRNDSLARLERVTAKLKQTVEWHSAGHQSKNKAVLRSASFARTAAMGPCFHNHKGGAGVAGTVYEEVLQTVQGGHNRVTFTIPPHVPPSYTGRLVQIRYYVSVTAKTPSGFTSPKIHIPLDVVPPRTAPPVTIARAVPLPTAPPLSDAGSVSSAARAPCYATTVDADDKRAASRGAGTPWYASTVEVDAGGGVETVPGAAEGAWPPLTPHEGATSSGAQAPRHASAREVDGGGGVAAVPGADEGTWPPMSPHEAAASSGARAPRYASTVAVDVGGDLATVPGADEGMWPPMSPNEGAASSGARAPCHASTVAVDIGGDVATVPGADESTWPPLTPNEGVASSGARAPRYASTVAVDAGGDGTTVREAAESESKCLIAS